MIAALEVEPSRSAAPDEAAAIDQAARWLIDTPLDERPRPLIPQLRQRFGLTTMETMKVIDQANAMRKRNAI